MNRTLRTLCALLIAAAMLFADTLPVLASESDIISATESSVNDTEIQLPIITSQPADAVCNDGDIARFTVSAQGESLSYQWQISDDYGNTWLNASAKTSKYLPNATAARHGRQFRCIITDTYGNEVISNSASLYINGVIKIKEQPADVTAKAGTTARFSVEAVGLGLTYQWQFSDNRGQTWTNGTVKTAVYGTGATASRHGRMVRCVVRDSLGTEAISKPASLYISGVLKITTQPADVICSDGDTAKFTVTAIGSSLTYKWQFSDDLGATWTASSAKSATYSTGATAARCGRMIRCIVTDSSGKSVTSDSAQLLINGVIKIKKQPADIIAEAGTTAKFSIIAAGAGLTYQWQLSDDGGKTWLNGSAKTAVYGTGATASRHGRMLRCIVKDSLGTEVISKAVTLYISGVLKIKTHPYSVVCNDGDTARFAVEAVGSSLTYQWQFSDDCGETWTNSSAKSAVYNTGAQAARHGRMVRCIVTDSNGKSVTSNPAQILINGLLKIKKQPADVIAEAGTTAKFSVTAVGAGLTYQWQFSDDGGKTWINGTVKTATYGTGATAARHGRMVRCVVTDKDGQSVVSKPAVLYISGILKITTQPRDVFCEAGDSARFEISAAGTDLRYQWQFSDNEGETWTNSSSVYAVYTTSASAPRHGRMIRCIVSDASGSSVTSEPARIIIESMLGIEIKSQPESIICAAGDTASFKVIADGIALNYQWEYSTDGENWLSTDCASDVYSFNVTERSFSAFYRCRIYDDYGSSCVSNIVSVTEESELIITHPQDFTACVNGKISFEVITADDNITCLWQISNNDGASWTTSSIVTPRYSSTAALSKNGWLYRCIVTDSNGNQQVSDAARLTVSDEFAIVSQPVSVSDAPDIMAHFDIQAGGEDVVFLWEASDDGENFTTYAENQNRIYQTIRPDTIGRYFRCVLTNGDGKTLKSRTVRLTVSLREFFEYNEKIYYALDDGTIAKGLFTIDGKLYYFGDNGAMRTGLQIIDGKIYYFTKDGSAATGFTLAPEEFCTFYFDEDHTARTGWTEIEGNTYYFYESGAMALGITQIGSEQYYFHPETGVLTVGFVKVGLEDYMYYEEGEKLPFAGLREVDGKLYYFSEQESDYGMALPGMQEIDGDTYYFDPVTKQAVRGFVSYNGGTYYMGDDCRMLRDTLCEIDGSTYLFSVSGLVRYGLVSFNGSRYYFDLDTGKAIYGWKSIDGANFYFDPDTYAAKTGKAEIDGASYYFGSGGHQITGIVTDNGIRYYFSPDGITEKGFAEYNKNTYYVNEDNTVKTSHAIIDGKMYYFDSYGVMKTGFRMVNDIRYYFDPDTGEAVKGLIQLGNGNTYLFNGIFGTASGLIKYNDALYYLNENGIVQYKMISIDGSFYYFDPATGKAVSGWQEICGSDNVVRKAYFDPDTFKAAVGLTEIDGKLYYFSSNGWALSGKQSSDGVTYYFSPSTYEAYKGWYRDTDGGDYYFDGSNGRLVGPGVFEIDGANYYLGSAGRRSTGLKVVGNARMYFDDVTAQSVDGFVCISDKVYYFDRNSDARYGLQTIGGNEYLFSDVGVMRYGLQDVNGVKCFFDEVTGIRKDGLVYSPSNNYYYLFDKESSTGLSDSAVEIGGVIYAPYTSGIIRTGYCHSSLSGLDYNVYFDTETGEQQFGLITYTNSTGTAYTYYFGKDSCITAVTAIKAELDAALSTDGWHTVSGLDYYVKDGVFLRGLQEIDGKTYYFSNLTGAMLTGLRRIGSDRYYFSPENGEMQKGVVSIDGRMFRFDTITGKQILGLSSVGDRYYYFLENGAVSGTVMINGVMYEFGEDFSGGKVAQPEKVPAPVQSTLSCTWGTVDGADCHYGMDGTLLTGLQIIEGKLYFFGKDGKLQTGLIEVGDRKYYFTKNGAVGGQTVVDGAEYYFSPSSLAMLTGMYDIDGAFCYYHDDGTRQSGWITTGDGERYYMTETGAQTGLAEIGGKTYYFGDEGVMRTGVQSVPNGSSQMTCLFGEDGAMVKGLVSDESGMRYYDETTGERITGFAEIDGEEYYFDPSTGKAATGMRVIDGFYCCFDDETAQRKYGIQNIGGKIYCFTSDSSGTGLTYGLSEVDGKTYFFSEATGIAKSGYHSQNDVKYYFDAETGASVSGIYRIPNGNVYSFKADGGIDTGWVTNGGRTYFFYPAAGLMAEGLASVGDTLYYFDFDKGMLKNTTVKVGGITYKLDENGAAAAVGDSKIVKLINSGIENLDKGYGDEGADENPTTFKCSQLVRHVFADIDIQMVKGVYMQYYSLIYGDYDTEIITDINNARAGDLIYYTIANCKYDTDCDFWSELHHVGIYLGDGKILESEVVEGDDFNDGVMIRDVSESPNAFISRIVRLKGVNDK